MAVNSGSETAAIPATNASTIAFLPSEVASKANEVISCLRTSKGLSDSDGPGAMALRKAGSSMPPASSLPADSFTAGIWTSARGAMMGLATTTPATTRATPVVKTGPRTLRMCLTAFRDQHT